MDEKTVYNILEKMRAGKVLLQGGFTSDTVWSCWYDSTQQQYIHRSYNESYEEIQKEIPEITVKEYITRFGESIIREIS